MSDFVRPHRWQPTRLPRPWDSPGKNTGVGCHFLLQCIKVKVKLLSCVPPLATPWTAAHQGPPSMGFSRQEYWSGLPLPSAGSPYKFMWGKRVWHFRLSLFAISGVERMFLSENFKERESRCPGGWESPGTWLRKAFQASRMAHTVLGSFHWELSNTPDHILSALHSFTHWIWQQTTRVGTYHHPHFSEAQRVTCPSWHS